MLRSVYVFTFDIPETLLRLIGAYSVLLLGNGRHVSLLPTKVMVLLADIDDRRGLLLQLLLNDITVAWESIVHDKLTAGTFLLQLLLLL